MNQALDSQAHLEVSGVRSTGQRRVVDDESRVPSAGASTLTSPSGTQDFFDEADAVRPPAAISLPREVFVRAPTAKVSEAYDAYWQFAHERQTIYFRRLDCERPPWTTDHILSNYRFTNVYRASDRVSQYLIKHIIYREDLPKDPANVVFRILLFKLFNRIETWELLTGQIGETTLADRPLPLIEETLTRAFEAGHRLYSAAYIIPNSRHQGSAYKHQTHLALIQKMMDDNVADRLADAGSMKAGFELLRSYPGIGDFLAYQFITDINYSDIVDFSESEFVCAGPGAREGLRKCFLDPGGRTDADLIRMMAEVQDEEFERLNLSFKKLSGRPLQLIDCQNIFCEIAKYTRMKFPHLTPKNGRTKIKQKYKAGGKIEKPFFPPKWGINAINDCATRTQALIRLKELDLDDYQRRAEQTRRYSEVEGGDITTPMLGLIGEVGEVLSEIKKQRRDQGAYLSFGERLTEELGDLLWYMADLATAKNIRLGDIVSQNLLLDQKTKPNDACSFTAIDSALGLAAEVGRLSAIYRDTLSDTAQQKALKSNISASLGALLQQIDKLAVVHRLSLAAIAEKNITKTRNRWGRKQKVGGLGRKPSKYEQLPDRFEAYIVDSNGHVDVSFKLDGNTFYADDRLKDNAYESDGYRFHDVFHFAYAAVLEWSPVTRRLLNCKRKSSPRTDEIEDGGRATVIEEGIAAMVFSYAKRHSMLKGVRAIDYNVLRTIRDMTSDLEVKHRAEGEWQDAILQGFEVWRRVAQGCGGRVLVDIQGKKIRYIG